MATDLVKQAMDNIEALEKAAAARDKLSTELDAFIDGVNTFCKESHYSTEAVARVWATIGDAIEKQSGMAPGNPVEGAALAQMDKNLADAGVDVGGKPPLGFGQQALSGIKNFFGNYGKQWKADPWGMAGKAALGAGVAGLGGLLYHGLSGGNKRPGFIKSVLMPALLTGAIAPWALNKMRGMNINNRISNTVAEMDAMDAPPPEGAAYADYTPEQKRQYNTGTTDWAMQSNT